MAFLLQDPDAKIRYGFDWEDWGTLDSAVFSVSPTGPTVTDIGDVGNIANCEVSDLVFGKTYSVTCRATLDTGEIVDQSLTILCSHK